MRPPLNIRIEDRPYDPHAGELRTHYKERTGEKTRYRVYLYLAGPDVPFVRSVTWRLHPTFKRPTRRVRRSLRNPDCRLVLWVWGVFTVGADVEFGKGERISLTHELTFTRHFPKDRSRFEAE